jgi:parallel beta-helix repeat protein
MKKKWLAVGIILLFVGTSIIPSIAQDTEKPLPASRGNWLYVGGSGPGNYTKIQDAIDNASDGDTIFVYDDSSPYYENIVVNKTINLVGEDKNTTVIDGQHIRNVIHITADRVNLTGFTIIKANKSPCSIDVGIYIDSNLNRIYNNNINQIARGIWIHYTHYQEIFLNNISTQASGIALSHSSNNRIYQNTIQAKEAGILIWGGSDGNKISNTSIEGGDKAGIYFEGADDNLVEYTKISNAHLGISILDGNNNKLTSNHYENCSYSICINYSSGCYISYSNFIQNKVKFFVKNDLGIKFYKNFYGRPRILPKFILGIWKIAIWVKTNSSIYIYIPILKIDWHPAQKRYDIPGWRCQN